MARPALGPDHRALGRVVRSDRPAGCDRRGVERGPEPARAAFVLALVKELPEPGAYADAPLAPASRPATRPSSSLEARLSVGSAAELRGVLDRAMANPAGLGTVLDAIAAEAGERAETREMIADQLAELLASAGPRAASELQQWALRQGDAAEAWIGRFLRCLFVEPLDPDAWRTFQKRTPPELQPAVARVVLKVALEPDSPDGVFRWAVEELLLPLGVASRPDNPAWSGAYLDRTPSGLDLLRRLFTKEYRNRGVKRWIDEARSRGELSPEQMARIDGFAYRMPGRSSGACPPCSTSSCRRFLPRSGGRCSPRSSAGSATARPTRLTWPSTPAGKRGRAGSSRRKGLEGLAQPIADAILGDRDEPEPPVEAALGHPRPPRADRDAPGRIRARRARGRGRGRHQPEAGPRLRPLAAPAVPPSEQRRVADPGTGHRPRPGRGRSTGRASPCSISGTRSSSRGPAPTGSSSSG